VAALRSLRLPQKRAGRLSRRHLIGSVGPLWVGAAALAAACRGGDEPESAGADGVPAQAGGAVTPAAETPVKGGTLRTGTSVAALGIDPHTAVGDGQPTVVKVYSYLGAYDNINQQYTLLNAESLEQPSDNEFIFKLRPGVRFHDIAPVSGREVNAQDVVYSFERFRDHPRAQGNAFYKTLVERMDAPEPGVFHVKTTTPYAEALSDMFGIQKPIIPREAVEKFGDLSINAIGAGPFMLDEYVRGERTVLKRNPNYLDPDLPHVDTIRQVTILDPNTLLQAFKSDQLDINGAELTKLDFDDLSRDDTLVTVRLPALYYGSLGVSVAVKPYDDPRVRQALYVGIDRRQFIDKIGLGEGSAMGPLNVGHEFWVISPEELKPYVGPDVKKARDLLSAAGYPDGFDMTLTTGSIPSYTNHAEVLIPELKKIGINARLQTSEIGSYLTNVLRPGNFEATVFVHAAYDTPRIPLSHYHKGGLDGGVSRWRYDNPRVNALFDTQNGALDVNQRRQIILDLQRAILEDWAPMINLFSPMGYVAYHRRLGGYDPRLRSYQLFRYSEFLKPTP